MPDFFEWQADQFIVSDAFRRILMELAPNKFQFLPITLSGPASLEISQQFYFLNCLYFDELIDWPRIQPQHNHPYVRDPQGRRLLRAPQTTDLRDMHFKRLPEMHVWREREIVTTEMLYLFRPNGILMTDDFWHRLNEKFPGQLETRQRFRPAS
jgi:hypothetical protein